MACIFCGTSNSFRRPLPFDDLFFPARGTFGKRSGRFRLNGWLRHPHDPFCHPVCFLLIDIIWLADFELCLEES
jgi:hypothetical protein